MPIQPGVRQGNAATASELQHTGVRELLPQRGLRPHLATEKTTGAIFNPEQHVHHRHDDTHGHDGGILWGKIAVVVALAAFWFTLGLWF